MTTLHDFLPPKEDYYSLLKQGGNNEKEYDYANQIYKRYCMKNIEQCHEFYDHICFHCGK